MHDNLESLVKILTDVMSILAALAVVLGKLAELETQIRLNRDHIRLHSELLSRLTYNLKAVVCDRADDRPVDGRSPH